MDWVNGWSTVIKRPFRQLAALAVLLAPTFDVHAATQRIEPDDYADGTVLNDIHPQVQLRIYDGWINPNFPQEFGVFPHPQIITVTATENPDIFGGYFTSTGEKSFGHAEIGFFNETRQLAMRFLAPTTQVTIDFIGSNYLAAAVGVLEIFNSQGTLLATTTTGPLFAHQISTLTLSRSIGDIGYARAFSSPDADPFGTLDNLRFVTQSVSSGDFNGDGVVNAADYAVWRKGLGTAYTLTHYDAWRQGFGFGAGTSSAFAQNQLAAIPEPASSLFIVAGLLPLCLARRFQLIMLRSCVAS